MRVWEKPSKSRASAAFTIVEAVISMVLVIIIVVALYSGMSFGFEMVTVARQNLRATQIAVEKMETLRMYSWEQINSNGFVPPTFTAPFYPSIVAGVTNNGGLNYFGTTVISAATNIATAYSNDMRLVTITLSWTNSKIAFQRQSQTYISQYGMQRYIY
jgi:Tfp pilus assembly protein PilV